MKVKVSASLLACDKNKIIEEVKKLIQDNKIKYISTYKTQIVKFYSNNLGFKMY